MPGERVAFDDRVQGRIVQDLAARRRRLRRCSAATGCFAYQLAVVVDDADLGVTDVVRGADLLDSTPRQIALQRALGLPTPRYLHFPVATHGRGEKLSKQTLAPAIDAAPGRAALLAALAFLGQDRAGARGDPARSSAQAARALGASHAYPGEGRAR